MRQPRIRYVATATFATALPHSSQAPPAATTTDAPTSTSATGRSTFVVAGNLLPALKPDRPIDYAERERAFKYWSGKQW